MLRVSQKQFDTVACARVVQRVAEMLMVGGAVSPAVDRKAICAKVAETMDEASSKGIKSERLLGMYVLLRLADNVDPFAVRDYRLVLSNDNLENEDKAHIIQMIRLGEINLPTRSA